MDTYIVRVYRRSGEDEEGHVGVIEEAGVEELKPFHTTEEMVSILTGEDAKKGRKTKGTVPSFGKERRLAERLKLNLPVKVNGTNTSGRVFSEETVLEDLSSKGAFLSLKNAVTEKTKLLLVIDPDRSNLHKKTRVVRVGKMSKKNGVGVSFEKIQ